jgi:hypothetical protein
MKMAVNNVMSIFCCFASVCHVTHLILHVSCHSVFNCSRYEQQSAFCQSIIKSLRSQSGHLLPESISLSSHNEERNCHIHHVRVIVISLYFMRRPDLGISYRNTKHCFCCYKTVLCISNLVFHLISDILTPTGTLFFSML